MVNDCNFYQLYAIRNSIIADLTKTPHLPGLAIEAGMTLTKMKVLFKQVFGDTIYNYYQKVRPEEAAIA